MTEPTKEQRETAIAIAEDWLGEKDDATWGWYPVAGTNLAMDIAQALAAAAQKAALEAEARVAEMREALKRIADQDNYGSDGSWTAESYPDAIAEAALSTPPGRFMALLEAAREYRAWAVDLHSANPKGNFGADYVRHQQSEWGKALDKALAAFPQPEEQP